ncbi:Hypothetical_protein [Hexamita inflata]|uniref:Hypothetical_protein n=1 Tax=Hexamita inflata TaxID=28002 RepID=A0AA86RJR1_9EUKA|nr:Hypothetical protein HINF_LOCUS65547 [Hexamita inflata]CAI9977906.1 Hypothetical protein HINF_LOCUS65551 [Hexamita inflata]
MKKSRQQVIDICWEIASSQPFSSNNYFNVDYSMYKCVPSYICIYNFGEQMNQPCRDQIHHRNSPHTASQIAFPHAQLRYLKLITRASTLAIINIILRQQILYHYFKNQLKRSVFYFECFANTYESISSVIRDPNSHNPRGAVQRIQYIINSMVTPRIP